jgi:CRP-like cAMP-binding protein
MELWAALKKTELFENMPEAGLKAIANVGEPVTVAAGDTILVEGGPADALWVIVSGSCRVYTERGGDTQQVVKLGPGDPFGASAVLESGSRSATVVATETSELVAFRADVLLAILDKDVQTAAPFYRALARSMFRRMRQTTNELGFARLESRDLRHA